MNPASQFSHARLWLYIGANCTPAIVDWLTLQFDTTPRGLLILGFKTLMTFCVTTRAYLDGKTTDKVVSEKTVTEPDGPKGEKKTTETTSEAANIEAPVK